MPPDPPAEAYFACWIGVYTQALEPDHSNFASSGPVMPFTDLVALS